MSFFDGLIKYWPVVAFLGGIIFQSIWTYFKVGEHTIKIASLESTSNNTTNVVIGVKNQISSIDAKLDILLTGYHKNK